MTFKARELDAAAVRACYEEKKSLAKVGAHFKCSRDTAKRFILKAGGTILPAGERPKSTKVLNEEEMQEAKRLVQEEGFGYRKLSAHFGISEVYANRIRQSFGRTPKEAKIVKRGRVIAALRDDIRDELRGLNHKSCMRAELEEQIDALNYALERIRYLKFETGE